jgi:hypothetical protein
VDHLYDQVPDFSASITLLSERSSMDIKANLKYAAIAKMCLTLAAGLFNAKTIIK